MIVYFIKLHENENDNVTSKQHPGEEGTESARRQAKGELLFFWEGGAVSG